MPMDETLGVAALDLSGRIHAVVDMRLKVQRVGDLQSELVTDFFEGFAQGARANVHVKVLYGRSSHHQVEALFKAFARALRIACSRDRRLAQGAPEHEGAALMGRVALIDYGAGNLTSVRKGLDAAGAEFFTPASPRSSQLPVPSSSPVSATLLPPRRCRTPWRRSIADAIERGTPLLGICLGLQWLFDSSDEAPGLSGSASSAAAASACPRS